jgi:signal transduction histidine kinase
MALGQHQRDIHERKAAQTENRRHVEELAGSNLRLEEFAYTVAHDLREPLRAISIDTEMLVRQTQMDPEARQMANLVVDGAARMSKLIDDLLAFATTGMHFGYAALLN